MGLCNNWNGLCTSCCPSLVKILLLSFEARLNQSTGLGPLSPVSCRHLGGIAKLIVTTAGSHSRDLSTKPYWNCSNLCAAFKMYCKLASDLSF